MLISIREEESEIAVLSALLVGTSEYSEWIEGGMIKVAQTQKGEYANLRVVYKCSVDGVSQRSTGTMPIKALPSQ